MNLNILLQTDSYKTSHHKMLPKNCTMQYGNWTGRSLNHAYDGITKIVSFGQQFMVQYLHEEFEKFFANPNGVKEAKEMLSDHLGIDYDVSHFQELHDLGYLPMQFKSLPEGVLVPVQVPFMTWRNTHQRFAWLSLYLETVISNVLWKPMTSATIARLFKINACNAVLATDPDSYDFTDFMIHDFSSRGMSSPQSSASSGLGFLTSARGTDTLPALEYAREYYDQKGAAGNSVFASEHSVSSACMGVMNEQEMISYYMDQYPEGILSIVSDTFDLTKVVKPHGGYLSNLYEKIMAREGKVVVRPDSSPGKLTPADIICGHDMELTDREKEADYPEFYHKGLIQCLWETFGGTTNSHGYKVLDPHVGAIYGEAISPELQVEIYQRLKNKGFAATNIVLGIGSYTLNMNSRDTLGFAAKATACKVDGKLIEIHKDPVTSSGFKKSAKGLLKVIKEHGEYVLIDQVSRQEELEGELQVIYDSGVFHNRVSFEEVRERIKQRELTPAQMNAFDPRYIKRTHGV